MIRRKLFNAIANHLIAKAMRTPYFHLHHADGSLYMERYWLVSSYGAEGGWIAKWWKEPSVWLLQKLSIAVRIHHICTADLDRALHDHPFNWASMVLRGGYLELRPIKLDPCFDGPETDTDGTEEVAFGHWRLAGSECVFRNATDRHRVTRVLSNTWTLFITGPKVQWWGFYTPAGKIYYRDYESVHNKDALP